MNFSSLSPKEVMRICKPETDLEKRLFEIAEAYEGDAESWGDHSCAECDYCVDAESKIDDLCAAMSEAISLIESGKLDDAKSVLRVGI